MIIAILVTISLHCTPAFGNETLYKQQRAELQTVKQRIVSQMTFAMLPLDSDTYRGHVERLDAEIDKLLAVEGGYWSVYDSVKHPNISMNGGAFNKPLKLATAYQTQHSRYYRNPTALKACQDGLRYLLRFVYPDCPKPWNWWAWQIGIPRLLLPTLILLEDHLDPELLAREIETITYLLKAQTDAQLEGPYRPTKDAYQGQTDTNTLWKAELQLQYAVLLENPAMAGKWAARVFGEIAPAGKGHLQPDYSYKFHGPIPMWAYGASFLIDYSGLIRRYHDLSLAPTPEQMELFHQMAMHYVEGFLYRGCICPALIGRTLTRSDRHHHHSYGPSGFAALTALVRAGHPNANQLAKIVAREKAYYLHPPRRWDRLAAGQQGTYTYADNVSGTMQPLAARMASLVHGLPDVEPAPPVNNIFAYPDSDFMQITRPDWAVGIKMHSKRNRPTEMFNGENMQGWFLSHGSMFHFLDGHEWDGCWPTLNWTRLPGTTATTAAKQPNQSPFAGVLRGSREVGLAAMELQAKDFRAQKSWLINGDHIICMGSNITGPGRVETTVFNQPVAADAPLLIDGEPAPTGQFEKTVHARSLWLQNVGYVFDDVQELLITRTTRTSSYDSVRDPKIHGQSKTVTHLYLTAVIAHTPQADSYCYTFLPNVTRDAMADRVDELTKKYSLESEGPHHIATTDGKLEAIVFWGSNSIGNTQADRACMMLRAGDAWQITDPTWNSEPLNVTLNQETHILKPSQGRPVSPIAEIVPAENK